MTDSTKTAVCSQCGQTMTEAVQLMVHEGRREKPAYYGFVHCVPCNRRAEFYALPKGYNMKKFGVRLPGIGVIKP